MSVSKLSWNPFVLPTYIDKDGVRRAVPQDPVYVPKACIRPETVDEYRVRAEIAYLEREK